MGFTNNTLAFTFPFLLGNVDITKIKGFLHQLGGGGGGGEGGEGPKNNRSLKMEALGHLLTPHKKNFLLSMTAGHLLYL